MSNFGCRRGSRIVRRESRIVQRGSRIILVEGKQDSGKRAYYSFWNRVFLFPCRLCSELMTLTTLEALALKNLMPSPATSPS